MEASSNCCSTKTIALAKKASDYALFQSAVATVFVLPAAHIQAVSDFIIYATRSADVIPYYPCESHAPPLFKLYSQYLFYDSI